MNSPNDVKLEADGARYYFKHLEWDTKFFGKKSFIINTEKSELKPSKRIQELIEKRLEDSFVTLRVDSYCAKELMDFFQDAGFRYIDTGIALRYNKDLKMKKGSVKNLEIYNVKKNQGLPYRELGGSFNLTRFHSDMHIPKKKADLLWTNYLKNYKPSPISNIFIAKYKNEIAGVILVNIEKEERIARLCFVAVKNKLRRRGIGSALIANVADYFSGYRLITETQAKNTGALNFYIKNGFSIIEATKTVMHRWS